MRRRRRSSRSRSPGGLEIKVDLEGGLEEYDLEEQVQEAMEAEGIGPAPRPTIKGKEYYDGNIPANLADLSDEEIGEYLSLTSRWYAYISGKLSKAQIRSLIATEKLKLVESFLRKHLEEERQEDEGGDGKPAGGKKYLDDDEVRTNPTYIQINAEKMRAMGIEKQLKRAEETAENNRRAVSNEVRNRENRGRNAGREQTVTGRRTPMRGRRKTHD